MSSDKRPLTENAVDAALNVKATLSSLADDFRRADKYFKYKIFIVTVWALLAVGAFGIACPKRNLANTLGAKLVASTDATSPIYMIKNEGQHAWKDVEITVNGRYRATLSVVPGGNGTVTLSSAVLFDERGLKAPSRLHAFDIRMKTREPSAEIVLLRGGEVEN
jgi:hypothetical protein